MGERSGEVERMNCMSHSVDKYSVDEAVALSPPKLCSAMFKLFGIAAWRVRTYIRGKRGLAESAGAVSRRVSLLDAASAPAVGHKT